MVDKVACCGPWIGEFGGELEHWQGWCRALKRKQVPDHHFIVCGYPGRQAMYEFADEYWPLPSFFMEEVLGRRVFARWAHVVDSKTKAALGPASPLMIRLHQWVEEQLGSRFPGAELVRSRPLEKIDSSKPIESPGEQIFIPLQTTKDLALPKKTIAMFPRNRINEPYRNWKEGNWFKLVQYMINARYHVVLVGTPNEAFLGDLKQAGVTNIIGQDLDTQIAALRRSILAVSPICGAIRFAAFVGCPAATFGSKGYLAAVARHEGKPLGDNPLNTPLYTLAPRDAWNYTADEVRDFVLKTAKEL